MPVPGRKGQTSKSWALMMLPKGISNTTFLCPQNRYNSKRGDHMVLFKEFPWKFSGTQSYHIFDGPSTMEDKKMVKVIQSRFGEGLLNLHM